MKIPVKIVQGRWKRDDLGFYEHVTMAGDMGEVANLRETEEYRKVVDLVKEKLRIREEDDVELTYKWPSWMMGPEGERSVPIDILDDEDMSLFMAIRADLEDVYLRVRVIPHTVGNNIHSYSGNKVTGSGVTPSEGVSSEDYMQRLYNIVAGVSIDNELPRKSVPPITPRGEVNDGGRNESKSKGGTKSPRPTNSSSMTGAHQQNVYSGNEVAEQIRVVSTNQIVTENRTSLCVVNTATDKGKGLMYPDINILDNAKVSGDSVVGMEVIEGMIALAGKGDDKGKQKQSGQPSTVAPTLNFLMPNETDTGHTFERDRRYIMHPHVLHRKGVTYGGSPLTWNRGGLNLDGGTGELQRIGSSAQEWVSSSSYNNKRYEVDQGRLESVRVNLFPDNQQTTTQTPPRRGDCGFSANEDPTMPTDVGKTVENPDKATTVTNNDDNDAGSAYEMWKANDAYELWRTFCATKYPPVSVPRSITSELGKDPEFDMCVRNLVDHFNQTSASHGDASLKLTLGVPTTLGNTELPMVEAQPHSQCQIYTVSSSDDSSGFAFAHEDISSEDNLESGDDMDIDSGSSSDPTPLGYSTTMPTKYSQPLQLVGVTHAIDLGGPSYTKNVPIAQPVILKDTPVPTVLRDRDAPPYFDDPLEEDDLRRALRDVDYEGDDIFIGHLFKTRDDCRMKLAIHAIHRKFHFRCAKSEPHMLIAVCVSDSCPWRVYAAKMDDSERFEIRSATQQHTCSVDARGNFHKQASTSVIGDLMKTRYVGVGRGPRPSELRRMLRQEFSLNVSYWKAWRAKEIAMDNALGSAIGSFALTQPYFRLLMETNPNSAVSLETELDGEGHERFKYLFMSLNASIQGFAYMRKVVVIDGTHLRGKYGGCLVAASAQDANFQIFPLAFGIVNSENDDAWTWFMRKLSEIVQDDPELVFVSDRHSSIYASMRRVYPMSSHAACVVHLRRNIDDIFKNPELSDLVNDAARAFRLQDFTRLFGRIREMNGDCADYLTGIGFEHWTRSHFLGNRYNVMTSNVAESLNNVLTMARDYPIISILETLRTTLVTWFALRREAALLDDNTLPPKVHDMVIEKFEEGAGFMVLKIGDGQYEVRDSDDSAFAVHLWERTCTCREFQLLTIPCSHAVAAAIKEGILVETLVGVHHTVAILRLSYSGLIMPVPDMATLTPSPDDIGGGHLAPPHVRRPPGRPRKRRIFSRGEFKRTARRRCGRCRALGHNRSTCKKQITGP